MGDEASNAMIRKRCRLAYEAERKKLDEEKDHQDLPLRQTQSQLQQQPSPHTFDEEKGDKHESLKIQIKENDVEADDASQTSVTHKSDSLELDPETLTALDNFDGLDDTKFGAFGRNSWTWLGPLVCCCCRYKRNC